MPTPRCQKGHRSNNQRQRHPQRKSNSKTSKKGIYVCVCASAEIALIKLIWIAPRLWWFVVLTKNGFHVLVARRGVNNMMCGVQHIYIGMVADVGCLEIYLIYTEIIKLSIKSMIWRKDDDSDTKSTHDDHQKPHIRWDSELNRQRFTTKIARTTNQSKDAPRGGGHLNGIYEACDLDSSFQPINLDLPNYVKAVRTLADTETANLYYLYISLYFSRFVHVIFTCDHLTSTISYRPGKVNIYSDHSRDNSFFFG